MLKLLFLSVLAAATLSSLNKNQLAEITYHDKPGRIHTLHLQYFIENERLQYGVKFSVNLYKIQVEDCKPVLTNITEEYFSVYLKMPDDCNPFDVVHLCQTHGANFAFLESTHSASSQTPLLSNNFQIPVFQVDASEDVFQFQATRTDKAYISLFFLMVR